MQVPLDDGPVRVAYGSGPGRDLDGEAERYAVALCEGVRDAEVEEIEVVDDLAVLPLAIRILMVACEMPVRPLPPVTEVELPVSGFEIRASLRAKHGHALVGAESALGVSKGSREESSQHDSADDDKQCAVFHDMLL